ncbi:unnamed protein product, partial [Mesorhabditis belari]|uniref:Uncharacterized protein n=1 Tax=Mesorhabditis belari TaxID=2138241 RepID=A0AAF3ERU9_9BILA
MTRDWLFRPCWVGKFESPVRPEKYGPCGIKISIVRLIRWFYLAQLLFALPVGGWWTIETYHSERQSQSILAIAFLVYMLAVTVVGLILSYTTRPLPHQLHWFAVVVYLSPILVKSINIFAAGIRTFFLDNKFRAQNELPQELGLSISFADLLLWSGIVIFYYFVHLYISMRFLNFIYQHQLDIEVNGPTLPFIDSNRETTAKRSTSLIEGHSGYMNFLFKR